jgi:hypothetical protein
MAKAGRSNFHEHFTGTRRRKFQIFQDERTRLRIRTWPFHFVEHCGFGCHVEGQGSNALRFVSEIISASYVFAANSAAHGFGHLLGQ